ncbi:MAG: hypothetical protein Kow00124_29390 [Anaerolineae bacterium]
MVDDAGTPPNPPPAAEPAPPRPDPDKFRLVSGPLSRKVPYLVPDLPPYFVPRTELYALKRQLLDSSSTLPHPLTLHGPPGSGKTALATALAHDSDILAEFPDGVLWVSLGRDEDPQHAQRLWGEALGNDLNHIPDTNSRASALRQMLSERRCLLIIDDASDVEQVRALNVGGPRCVRLITTDNLDSLSALRARRYAINKLRDDEALTLLTEWAGILPDIYLPTVREIITRLCHQPLALALVGGQARQGITWLRLLEVLRDDQGPIAMLKTDDPRVRSNALGLVVNIVLSRFGSDQMRRTALLGSVAAGTGTPFSVEAAAACWDLPIDESARLLEVLVEAAVLQRHPGGYYALHRAMRDHLRRLVRPADLLEASQRVRAYYLKLLEHYPAETSAIDKQLGQVLAAYHQAAEQDPTASIAFADALMAYFERRGLWSHFVTLATSAIETAAADGDVVREHVYLSDLGYAQTVLGNLAEARRCFERSLHISETLDDPSGQANALNNLGAIYEREREYEQAESYYRRSLVLRQQIGVREDIASTMNNLAGVLYWQQRWDEALNIFERVLDMYNVLNDRQGQAQTYLNIGAVYESMGDDYEALQAYHRSLAIYANLGDEAGQANALNNIGIVHLNRGETSRALDHFKRSLALKEKLNDPQGQASTLNNIALLYERTGSRMLALEHYERSYRLLKAVDDPRAAVVEENIRALKE